VIVAGQKLTRVKTSDDIFAVEIHPGDDGRAEFFVAGDRVAPDAFIASVLVEWFDQLRSKPDDVQHEEH